MHKRLNKVQLFFIALGVIGLVSCSNSRQKSHQVFHYNQPNAVTSLDPAFARSQSNIWVVDHLYNTLVQINDNLEVVPDLAKKWSISDDGLRYEFILNRGVKYHQKEGLELSRDLTAEDVAHSLGRIIDPEVNSPGSWIFENRLRDIDPFVAIDDTTFHLFLKKPFLPMLGILTMQYCSILPVEAVDHFGDDLRINACGTGPFAFKKWREGQGLFLSKNETYFQDGLPSSDGVRISFMTDRKTAFLELLSGGIDAFSGIDASYRSELINAEGELRDERRNLLQLVKSPYLNTEYLGINLEKAEADQSILRFKEVRQAMNYAVDRNLMLGALKNGVGVPAEQGFIPRGLPSFDEERTGYTYNLKKAMALLDSLNLGVAIDEEITLHTNKDYLDICLFLSRQWEEIGLNIKVELLETSALRELMRKGQTSFFRASWIADYPDGESFLTVFYGQNPAPPNYTRFRINDFDILYEESLGEKVDSIRLSMYSSMDKMIIEEAPVIFLYYDETALFVNKKWTNLSRNAFNLLKLDQVRKTNL